MHTCIEYERRRRIKKKKKRKKPQLEQKEIPNAPGMKRAEQKKKKKRETIVVISFAPECVHISLSTYAYISTRLTDRILMISF